jgi:hypothetical protein
LFEAAIRDDLPPHVMLFDGAAEDGGIHVGSDLDVTVWAMTPRTWDALTSEQRAEFST